VSDAPVCAGFHVTGRVQGVFFRAATRDEARRLGLTGWVRNREDGGVELVACGPAAAVDALEKWLWQGTPSARVEAVTRSPRPAEVHRDFRISY